MDFIQISMEFFALEEFEIDMLLELYKESLEVKAKLDKNGKLFDVSGEDSKSMKLKSVRYEILKRSKRTSETYQAGIDFIKATYDDSRQKNDPSMKTLFDLHELYALSINECEYGCPI
jgi:hypothetical protein